MSTARVQIAGLGTALPEHRVDPGCFMRFQAQQLEIAVKDDTTRARALGLLERIVPRSGIDSRYSVIADFSDLGEGQLFGSHDPSTEARMKLYEELSMPLAEVAARRALDDAGWRAEEITHLVVCTCTGFFAPGPDVELCRRLRLSPDVARLQIGYMGCFAGFNGLRTAGQIATAQHATSGRPARVLLVSVELCSLHFQRSAQPELLVSNALFGDGAALQRSPLAQEGESNSVVNVRGCLLTPLTK